MDAVKFIKEYRRMCKKYAYMEACGESCSSECPLYDGYCDVTYENLEANYIVSKVEQWSQAHPQKTMMQDFFEKFPNAPTKNDNYSPIPCPDQCGYENIRYCVKGDKTVSGCKECWSRPLED